MMAARFVNHPLGADAMSLYYVIIRKPEFSLVALTVSSDLAVVRKSCSPTVGDYRDARILRPMVLEVKNESPL